MSIGGSLVKVISVGGLQHLEHLQHLEVDENPLSKKSTFSKRTIIVPKYD